jgi:hypothetical protein
MDKKKNIVEPLPKDLEEAIFGEIKQIDINIDVKDVPDDDFKRLIILLKPFNINEKHIDNLISLCYEMAILFQILDDKRDKYLKNKIKSKRSEFKKLTKDIENLLDNNVLSKKISEMKILNRYLSRLLRYAKKHKQYYDGFYTKDVQAFEQPFNILCNYLEVVCNFKRNEIVNLVHSIAVEFEYSSFGKYNELDKTALIKNEKEIIGKTFYNKWSYPNLDLFAREESPE